MLPPIELKLPDSQEVPQHHEPARLCQADHVRDHPHRVGGMVDGVPGEDDVERVGLKDI
jgi:hypothetical protein